VLAPASERDGVGVVENLRCIWVGFERPMLIASVCSFCASPEE